MAVVAFISYDFPSEHGEEVATGGNFKSTRPQRHSAITVFESKRGFCFRLLDAFADAGVPIHEEPENIINAETLKRLKGWCSDLTEGEGEELQEDVGVAAQWIPKRLINEIESWSDGSRQDTDEVSVCGRMLAWLALLRIVDVASSRDTMNRPALTSYISKCQSVDDVLNATLNYANIGK